MSTTPKTIQIFLPAGDPRGIRVAEVTTRIVQVIEVPRSLLPTFLSMPESEQVALYFLVGESEDGSAQQVYVGQTGDLHARLDSHNRSKDFWTRALVLISRTNNLTQTHSLFLEWHSLQKIRQAQRYSDVNGNNGTKPYTPPPLEADCIEIFETGHTLLATLGYSLFDAVAKASSVPENDEIFYCRASGADGRGRYTEEGFVVLKGSSGRREILPSIKDPTGTSLRDPLFEAGIIKADGDKIIFVKDHLFKTPSGAASAVLGRSANGWTEWKSKDGQTLDALKRQSLAP